MEEHYSACCMCLHIIQYISCCSHPFKFFSCELSYFVFTSCFLSYSALLKSTGLRSDGRIDDRSFWINYVSPLPTPLVIPLVYPRMIAIHDLDEKVYIYINFFLYVCVCVCKIMSLI